MQSSDVSTVPAPVQWHGSLSQATVPSVQADNSVAIDVAATASLVETKEQATTSGAPHGAAPATTGPGALETAAAPAAAAGERKSDGKIAIPAKEAENVFIIKWSDMSKAPAWRKNYIVDWMWPNFYWDQFLIYFGGLVTFTFGANCFIYSDLGTDPLDVFALGMVDNIPHMTVGIAQATFAALCLAIWALWNRRLPIISPFVTFGVSGTLIDLWLGGSAVRRGENVAEDANMGNEWGVMFVGVVMCAYGSSLIIMSGIGIRSMDLVAITMVRKWKLPFWACKGILEALLLFVGWTLGGPLGYGTLFFLAFVGWMIQPLMWFNSKVFRLPNYGLKQPLPGEVPAEEENRPNCFKAIYLFMREKYFPSPAGATSHPPKTPPVRVVLHVDEEPAVLSLDHDQPTHQSTQRQPAEAKYSRAPTAEETQV